MKGKYKMDETNVGIGIIGSGFMGRTYAETTARYNRNARLVGVAGGQRAEGLAADYGVAFEPSVERLIARSDVDAVIVTSPETVHLEQTQMAAAAEQAFRQSDGSGGPSDFPPIYVIGTDVPPPGGIRANEETVPVTRSKPKNFYYQNYRGPDRE